MYKTDFIVKYNSIENELLQLLEKKGNEKEGDEDDDEEEDDYKYTKSDILNICDKLYRDELISVFDADSLEDPKLDSGMQLLFDKLTKYEVFNLFLQDVGKHFSYENIPKTNEELTTLKRNSDSLIFVTMFSQQVFHITHKWICNLLSNGIGNTELMEQIKEKIVTVITHS